MQETQQQFPGVDFSLIQSEEDTMWPEFNHFDEQGNRVNDGSADFGEPEAHVTQRGIKFLHWLMSRYDFQHICSLTCFAFPQAWFSQLRHTYTMYSTTV